MKRLPWTREEFKVKCTIILNEKEKYFIDDTCLDELGTSLNMVNEAGEHVGVTYLLEKQYNCELNYQYNGSFEVIFK